MAITLHLKRLKRAEKAIRGTINGTPHVLPVARATTQYDSQPRCSYESSSRSRSPQKLEIVGGPIEDFILSTLENAEYIIPCGKYELKMTWSPRFRKIMPLVDGVKSRSGIRIHTGTIPEHSKGCILMTPKGVNVITELLTKYAKKDEKVYLRISDAD